MKILNLITPFLILLAVANAFDKTTTLVTPEIKGVKGDIKGRTDNTKVRCILRYNTQGLHKEGSNVEGNLVIQSDYVTSGVYMTVYKAKGFELISSCSLKGTQIGKQTEYKFTVNKDLIKSTVFTILSPEGMRKLNLKSITISPPQKNK